MFENLTRFSEPGRRALTRANEHAQAAGDSYVRPEHLLLALAANPEESTAGRALQMFDVTAERLREELPAFTSPPEEAAALELPLDAALSELLASALCRTQQRTDETVTTMLMLLALAEQPTDASSVLERYGADADALGKVALTLQSETVVRPTGPSAHISAEPARSPAESTRTHETPDGSPSEPTSQPTSGPGAPPRSNPTPGRRFQVTRLFTAALIGQLLLSTALTLDGWGSQPLGDAHAPRMERVGAPPGLIGAYASLSNITRTLQDGSGHHLATATYVGTPATWGGAEPTPPSLDIFGQSPAATLHQLSAGSANTVLFVIPSSALARAPLTVLIAGKRHPLTEVTDGNSQGFAVTSTTIENKQLSEFDSDLLWLTSTVPRQIHLGLMLVRRNPTTRQSYEVTSGSLAANGRPGTIAPAAHGLAIGGPVVGVDRAGSALVGFLESAGPGPSRFTAASSVAETLSSVAPSVPGGF